MTEPKTIRVLIKGEGPVPARIMFIGQNPGAEEVDHGRPFVGAAGKFLEEVLEKYGIPRRGVFIINVVRYRTPGNRQPSLKEVREELPFLLAEIKRVQPRIIVLMGRVARTIPRCDGIIYVETYHPAAARRFLRIREKFESDIKWVKKLNDKIGLSGDQGRN